MWMPQCYGTYINAYPNHYGIVGPKNSMLYLGSGFIPNTSEAYVAPGYWSALAGLNSGAPAYDLLDEDHWAFFVQDSGFDLLMQKHLGASCDEVADGFIAFREINDDGKKEVAADFGGERTAFDYGDYSTCLYAPKVNAVDYLKPVSNEELYGVFAPGGDITKNDNAKGQYYTIANKPELYNTRKLDSQYAYLDIDEGITSRSDPLDKWRVRVVYLNVGFDKFSIDY